MSCRVNCCGGLKREREKTHYNNPFSTNRMNLHYQENHPDTTNNITFLEGKYFWPHIRHRKVQVPRFALKL